MQKINIEVEAPKDMVAGEKFIVEVEVPEPVKKQRGLLAGLTVEEMDDEQLKREMINAKSVLYKAVQRGASEETIAANKARVEAVTAEKAKRVPVVVATALDAEFAEENTEI